MAFFKTESPLDSFDQVHTFSLQNLINRSYVFERFIVAALIPSWDIAFLSFFNRRNTDGCRRRADYQPAFNH